MATEALTGGQAAVAMLSAHGVDTIFCLPGIQNDYFFNALYDHNREAEQPIRVVHSRHEQGAGYMALGYAVASGGVGVFSVVPGPGLLNSTAALATAYAVNAKVFCLTGQLPSGAIGREIGLLHEVENQLDIIDAVTKWSARATSPGEVPTLMNEAFEELYSGRPRPVGLEIPMDVLPATAEIVLPEPSRARLTSEISPALIDTAAALLAGAERPMIFVGGGAQGVGPEIVQLAEFLQAPVVSNRAGKGVIDGRHQLSIPERPAMRYWADADVVLAVGSNMRVPLQRWAKDHLPTIIRIDVDQSTHDRIVSPELAITGRAENVLPRLISQITRTGVPRESRVIEIAELRQWWATESGVLEPQVSFLASIREAIGEDGVFVDELTQVAYVARLTWEAYKPRTYITSGYQGTLGYGFPTALGVKVARPEVPVVSITGDGGFMFCIQELATAVQHRIPVVVLVFNNKQYGNVQMMQKEDHGGRVIATDLLNPDFVALAESFGAVGVRADSPEAVGAAITESAGRDLPTVVEITVGEMPSMDRFR